MTAQTPLQPKDKSDSKWLRDGGYPNIIHFMASYGLKWPDEIDEAKELINSFRKEEQKQWEAANINTGNETVPMVLQVDLLIIQ
jgi:hypothetical protein